jgi:hypothetical protein
MRVGLSLVANARSMQALMLARSEFPAHCEYPCYEVSGSQHRGSPSQACSTFQPYDLNRIVTSSVNVESMLPSIRRLGK